MSAPNVSRLIAVAGAVAAVGCDKLTADPGRNFGVSVLSASPITVVGKITAPVQFAVTGCASFDLAVQAGAGSHAVDFSQQNDGTFLAAVPVEWLREEDRTCLDDARTPHLSHAQLLVTCHDAGRTATADLAVSYGTATRAYLINPGGGLAQITVQFLFQSADPLVPYALAPSALEYWASLYPVIDVPLWTDRTVFLADPLARPRVTADASSVFVSSGCYSLGNCPGVPVPPSTTVPSELLAGQGLGAWRDALFRSIWVPASVLDMAFAPSGALVVLSQVGDSEFPPTASVVSKVVPHIDQRTADVTVIGYFPGERVETRFSRTADGQLAFVSFVIPATQGPIQSVLHTTDGEAVTSRTDVTGTVPIGYVYPTVFENIGDAQLAPDATALVVNGHYLGSPDYPYLALPTSAGYPGDGDRGGAVWLSNGIALWRGSSFTWRISHGVDDGKVEVFDAAAPHARKYGYEVHPLPGSRAVGQLFGATGVGDKLILTTNTGVRVLGPDGTVIGGSDPLPCGLEPTALAVATGPTTFAVAAATYVYVFDEAN